MAEAGGSASKPADDAIALIKYSYTPTAPATAATAMAAGTRLDLRAMIVALAYREDQGKSSILGLAAARGLVTVLKEWCGSDAKWHPVGTNESMSYIKTGEGSKASPALWHLSVAPTTAMEEEARSKLLAALRKVQGFGSRDSPYLSTDDVTALVAKGHQLLATTAKPKAKGKANKKARKEDDDDDDGTELGDSEEIEQLQARIKQLESELQLAYAERAKARSQPPPAAYDAYLDDAGKVCVTLLGGSDTRFKAARDVSGQILKLSVWRKQHVTHPSCSTPMLRDKEDLTIDLKAALSKAGDAFTGVVKPETLTTSHKPEAGTRTVTFEVQPINIEYTDWM